MSRIMLLINELSRPVPAATAACNAQSRRTRCARPRRDLAWSLLLALIGSACSFGLAEFAEFDCGVAPTRSALAADSAPAGESKTEPPRADIKAAAPTVGESRDQLTRRRAELADRLGRLGRQSQQTDATAAEALEAEIDSLKALDLLLLQHDAALELHSELLSERKSWAEDVEHVQTKGLNEPKPYTLSLLDDTEDQYEAESARGESADGEVAIARQMLAAARDLHDECQRERRRIFEDTEESGGAAQLAQRKLAELGCVVAAETVSLRRAELDVKLLTAELCGLRKTYYEERLKRLEGNVQFTEAELETRRKALRNYGAELRSRMKEIEQRLEKWPSLEAAARNQLRIEAAPEEVLDEAEAAWQGVRRGLHERLTMLNQRLAELNRFDDFIGWRFRAASGMADRDDLKSWQETLTEFDEQLSQAETALTRRIEELRLDQSTMSRRLRALDDNQAAVRIWIQQRLDNTHELAGDCESGIVQLKTAQRILRRCLTEVEKHLPSDDIGSVRDRLQDSILGFWNYEIAAVDDRPITIGKVVGALTYLLLGVIFASIVSRIAGRRVLPRVGMDRGRSMAIQTITFYTLCAVGGLLALEFAHLPLTTFAFLGGAAAIGVGFGSQNILNNFISGLILLAEQPIRVGDVVELNGVYGTIEHIGARSTRVRTGSNFELIVPNSKLLENNVVNLTLSDNSIRTKITIGVAYGTPIADMKRLLEDAARGNERVLVEPAPAAMFTNFGERALEFELNFSVCIHSFGECRQIECAVREAVELALRNGDIRFPAEMRPAEGAHAIPLDKLRQASRAS
ncbi:MAG TPA: mechanosensitive ion channel [Pirellulaceae bacterium]|nr:mechanosensitive ion channel [Pirellulaceae bacterium]